MNKNAKRNIDKTSQAFGNMFKDIFKPISKSELNEKMKKDQQDIEDAIFQRFTEEATGSELMRFADPDCSVCAGYGVYEDSHDDHSAGYKSAYYFPAICCCVGEKDMDGLIVYQLDKEKVSNCCSANPSGELNGDIGFCSKCGEGASFIRVAS